LPEVPAPTLLMMAGAFLLLLGPLVVLHELGHYLVGRWCGVRAEAFSVGFGNEVAGWTDKRGTRWKLSLLPLGGYVKFAGDMNAAGMPDGSLGPMIEPDMFQARPLWQRALIVAAGPVTNLLCAIAIFTSFNLIYGTVVAPPEIALLEPGSPASRAGLRVGDEIAAIDGHAIANFTEIPAHIVPYPGQQVVLDIRRDGRAISIPVQVAAIDQKDEFGNEARIGRIGIGPPKPRIVPVDPVEAVSLGTHQTLGIMRMMATGIGQLFTGERSVKELGGPLTIARYSGEQLSLGWQEFVSFAALISINLAFINLLPIPTLDGGHLAFYAAEAVRRKPLALRSQEWAFRTGLAFVLALMLIVTINDLSKLPIFGG
jgi:regulator of sigma E protease